MICGEHTHNVEHKKNQGCGRRFKFSSSDKPPPLPLEERFLEKAEELLAHPKKEESPLFALYQEELAKVGGEKWKLKELDTAKKRAVLEEKGIQITGLGELVWAMENWQAFQNSMRESVALAKRNGAVAGGGAAAAGSAGSAGRVDAAPLSFGWTEPFSYEGSLEQTKLVEAAQKLVLESRLKGLAACSVCGSCKTKFSDKKIDGHAGWCLRVHPRRADATHYCSTCVVKCLAGQIGGMDLKELSEAVVMKVVVGTNFRVLYYPCLLYNRESIWDLVDQLIHHAEDHSKVPVRVRKERTCHKRSKRGRPPALCTCSMCSPT